MSLVMRLTIEPGLRLTPGPKIGPYNGFFSHSQSVFSTKAASSHEMCCGGMILFALLKS